MPLDEIPSTISKMINRITDTVSIYPLLLAVGIFGVFGFFIGFVKAFFASCILLAVSGLFDVFHREKKADLTRRETYTPSTNARTQAILLIDMVKHDPAKFCPDTPDEFKHRNLFFKLARFTNIGFPLEVLGPFCPECSQHLLYSGRVLFPGRTQIKYSCTCGFSVVMDTTPEELQNEVSQMSKIAH